VERLGEPILLQEDTVQEIQLELLRRTSFNALDGERIARSLMAYRDLWLAVMLDRQPHWSRDYTHLPFSWLIKMRDLPGNIWNADSLFIVTDSVEKARRIEQIVKDEDWGGEVCVYDD